MHALIRLRARTKVLQGVGTHDLRRTLATRLGAMGISDEVIGKILNHAPTTVTGKHYNHAQRFSDMKAALEQWDHRLRVLLDADGACLHPRLTPHDLRRTAATLMGDLGVADEVVGRVLNHSQD